MATKKFINGANDVVHESLSGLCCAYPRLDYHATNRVVLQENWHERPNDKVAVLSGGGSGHEPFAAGFVGEGMLFAAVAGDVFAAPTVDDVLHAISCASRNDNDAGCFVVVPNYTGDCLNFGIAVEDAKQNGFKIDYAIIGDDCSIPTEEQGRAGKRGLVGILFAIKIAGSLAKRGECLEGVKKIVETVVANVATYGVGFSTCSLPGQAVMFEIPPDEMEIGLGVHGEAGYERIAWRKAAEIVEMMLERIAETLSLVSGNAVAVIVNNFGSTSQSEQGIVVHQVVEQLKKRGITPFRVYSGALMTSLDSAGAHVSILRLDEDNLESLVSCLDDETDAPCWPGRRYTLPGEKAKFHRVNETIPEKTATGKKFTDSQAAATRECLKKACEKIAANAETINSLDRGCGDGDCGSTHKKLADAALLTELSRIAREVMGGTSGAVYSLFFKAAASEFARCRRDDDTIGAFIRAWKEGAAGIARYSKARPGDRTMLDSLIPACRALEENSTKSLTTIVEEVTKAAWTGCEATKNMKPMTGRASYVKQAEFLNKVDAGSYAVALWIEAAASTIVKFA